MSRSLSLSITVVAAAVSAVLLPGVAYADIASVTGNCTTTYAGALASDALVNGPVHNGGMSGGDFTPSVLISGATVPTGGYVTCMV